MFEDGINEYIEIGAGNVLQGLVKKILNEKNTEITIRGFDKEVDLKEL